MQNGGQIVVNLTFTLETQTGRSERQIAIDRLIVAGWTGRDRAKMEAHIAELEALGVTRPKTTPVFYRVSASRLTTAPVIEVPGSDSSGEAETLLINDGGTLLVGLASDHTDRKVEAYNITVSKQICDKPCAPVLWPLDEVQPHWDRLQLASVIEEDGALKAYQHGSVAGMLAPAELIAALEAEGDSFGPGSAMFGGTLPALGGVRPAPSFAMTLEDPVLGRKIGHRYEIVSLPVAG